MGKGSARRPHQVSQADLDRRWAKAFGAKRKSREESSHAKAVDNNIGDGEQNLSMGKSDK